MINIDLGALITDIRVFLVPVFVFAAFLFVWLWRRGGLGEDTWMRVFHVEAFTLPFVVGLFRGFAWPKAIASALRGSDLSVTWGTILTTLGIMLTLLGLVLAFRRLGEKWQWLGTALLAFHIGALTHHLVFWATRLGGETA